VIVVVAALAMLATLPGRTHGLGMITERLLADRDLGLDRVQFADMNFWATILGAAFCLPCGKLLDRFGIRLTLTAVALLLGIVVLAMTQLSGLWSFFMAILLTRGLGQSALSVVSLAMVGKWFSRRLSLAMGVYTVLMAGGFISAFQIAGLYRDAPWQSVWAGLGYALLFGMAPIALIFVRNGPEECGLAVDGLPPPIDAPAAVVSGATLRAALREPSFWAFALATSLYGLVSSGISLFNEAILLERGFPKETYYTVLKMTTGLGLAGNFAAGYLVHSTSLRTVMGLSMSLLAAALFWMPFVSDFSGLVAYVIGMAIGGGMMTVVFFTAFGQVFGRRHLGEIQGVAQMLTVFASALGPELLAHIQDHYHSYMPFFQASGLAVLALIAWTCILRMPVVNEDRQWTVDSGQLENGRQSATVN
jgi:MFS family permease